MSETIHQLMGKVMKDVGAVRKGGWNPDQKFHFRALEDVMNAAHEALTEHGVFFLPEVQERIAEQRVTSRGTNQHVVNLRIRFTFYGPAGDSAACEMWGEGVDSGDKATSKAESAALKYALMQTLCIPTLDAADADGESPEETISNSSTNVWREPRPESTTSSHTVSHGKDPRIFPLIRLIKEADPQARFWSGLDLRELPVSALEDILAKARPEGVSA